MQIEVRSHFNKRFWNFGVLKLTRLQFKIKFYLLSIWKKYFLSNFKKNCSFFQNKKSIRPKNMEHYSPSLSACYYLFSYQICRQVDHVIVNWFEIIFWSYVLTFDIKKTFDDQSIHEFSDFFQIDDGILDVLFRR